MLFLLTERALWAVAQIAKLMEACNTVSGNLLAITQHIAELKGSSSTTPPALIEQAIAAAGTLQRLLQDPPPPPAGRDQRRRQLLEACEHAAAVVAQHLALPQQAQAAQLELARAAAGRSCAYLRCPNVERAGGALAGQGEGSMRCR